MNIRLIFPIAMLIAFSGCAVKPISFENKPIDDSDTNCKEQYLDGACKALQLADGYRRGYLRRADSRSSIREIGGLMSIGAATGALYYGLEGREKYRDRVVRLTAATAGLLGAGQWALQPSTDLVYHEGAIAMSCAALLAYPVLIPKTAVNGMDDKLKTLEKRMDEVNRLLPTVFVADSADGEAAVVAATTALVAGHALAGQAGFQSSVLLAHVQLLNAEVQQLLTSNAPNFQSLQAILAQLPAAAKTAGSDNLKPPAGSGPATGSSGAPKASRLITPTSSSSALEILATAVRKLRETTGNINFRLARAATASASLGVLSKCKPKSSARFAVAPDALAQDVNKTLTLVITDKGGFPGANIVGDNVAAVKLSPIELGSRGDEFKLTLTAVSITTDATKRPTLALRSTSGLDGRNVVLNVTEVPVAPKAKSPEKTDEQRIAPTRSSSTLPDVPRTEYEQTLLTGDRVRRAHFILAVQCHLKDSYAPGRFSPDCVLGQDTRNAISAASGSSDLLRKEVVDAAVAALPDSSSATDSRCGLPIAQRCNAEVESP